LKYGKLKSQKEKNSDSPDSDDDWWPNDENIFKPTKF